MGQALVITKHEGEEFLFPGNTKLRVDSTQMGFQRIFTDMQVDGDKIYLLYGDGGDIWGWGRLFFARSLDGGASFAAQQIDVPSEHNSPKSYARHDFHYTPLP